MFHYSANITYTFKHSNAAINTGMLSPDNNIQMPDFSQNFNRYSYCMNNPLMYTDPSGESFILAAILIGAAVGAYLGGTAANGNNFDPTMWDYKSGKTWAGMGIGGAAGALGGWGFAAGGTALAGALGAALPTFSSTSIAVASFGLAGGVMGGAVGFTAGFSGAYLYSGGNMDYSLQAGSFYAGIGSSIGMTAGLIYGFSQEARNAVESGRPELRDFYVDEDGTHRSVEQYEGYKKRVEDGTAPGWMQRNYNRWSNKINVRTSPLSSNANVNYNSSIYMGDYNQTGNWQVHGNQVFDLNTNLQFGANSYDYSVGNYFEMRRGGTLDGIRYVNINTSGIMDNLNPGYNSGLVLRLRVRH